MLKLIKAPLRRSTMRLEHLNGLALNVPSSFNHSIRGN